jgi:hypothetical protein
MHDNRGLNWFLRLEAADLRELKDVAASHGMDWSGVAIHRYDEDDEPTGFVEAGPGADKTCTVPLLVLFRMVLALDDIRFMSRRRMSWWLSLWARTEDGAVQIEIPFADERFGMKTPAAKVTLNTDALDGELAARIKQAIEILDPRGGPDSVIL